MVLSYHFGPLTFLAFWLAGDWFSIRLNLEVMASLVSWFFVLVLVG